MLNTLHLWLEIISTLLLFVIIIPAFLTFALNKERFRLLLGLGFLTAGIGNLFHVIVAVQSEYLNIEFFIPLSGLIPRTALPIFFLLAILIKKYSPTAKNPSREIFTMGPLFILISVSLFYVYHYLEVSSGLIFSSIFIKRPQDLMAGLFSFLVLILLFNNQHPLLRLHVPGFALISIASILLSISGDFNSLVYLTANVFKLMAIMNFAGVMVYDTWNIRNLEREKYTLYEELSIQKQFFENILKSIGSGVYITDTEKNIILWSRGAEVLTGFTVSEATGRKCSEFLKHRDDEGNVLCETPDCPITRVITTNDHVMVSGNFKNKLGLNKKIKISASPVLEKGEKLKHIVQVFSDVTEEKEAYHQLQLTHQKLLELDKLKNNLTAMIIHDLKNPLTAILSTAELVTYQKDVSGEDLNENLKIITSESTRMLNIINSLLDIEKLESGKLSIRKEIININDIIKNEIKLLKTSSELRNIKLVFHECQEGYLCNGDTTLIPRVIMNILDNAIKYAKTTVIISATLNPEDENELLISIENDGIGIPLEYQSRIFDKFESIELRSGERNIPPDWV